MPFYPFFCPYLNQQNEDLEDEDFRSPDGFGFPNFPGQGPGFGPPFGPPSGGQGPGQGPGFGPPFGPPSGGQGGPPGPPPSIVPAQQSILGGPSIKAVDPGAIRPCRYQFIYIWPSYGRPFWAWLTFVGRRSISGFRWNGRRWVYFGMDLRQIDSFVCY
jgi:hypothetical protein